MSGNEHHVRDVYDRKGTLLGIFLSREIWERAGRELTPILEQAAAALEADAEGPGNAEPQEPLRDWEQLKAAWDFAYPVDRSVRCEICGNESANWEQDSPRKFVLKAASLGGLVRFRCQSCKATIIKRHFKDSIQIETKPSTTS